MALPHAQALDIIDIRPLGSGLDDAVTTSLIKTPAPCSQTETLPGVLPLTVRQSFMQQRLDIRLVRQTSFPRLLTRKIQIALWNPQCHHRRRRLP